MDKPKHKITILFDIDLSIDAANVSGELLADLSAIMSQYGLKTATICVSANDETVSLNDELLEQPKPVYTDNDGNPRKIQHLKLLKFPKE